MKIILPFLILLNFYTYSQFDMSKIKAPYFTGFTGLEKGPNDVLWATTWGDGVYKSTDAAANWVKSASGLTDLYVNQVVYKDNLLIAACYSGVFKSTDEGFSWTQMGNSFTSEIMSVAIKTKDTIFIGTKGKGIFRTTDGGATWVEVNNGHTFRDILYVFVTDKGSILAATKGKGVFRSTDNGENWVRSNSGIISQYTTRIKNGPDGKIWLSAAGDALYNSSTDGNDWFPYNYTDLGDYNLTGFEFYQINSVWYPIVSTRNYGVWYFDWNPLEDKWKNSSLESFGAYDIVRLSTGEYVAACGFNSTWISSDSARTFIRSTDQANFNPFHYLECIDDYLFYSDTDNLLRTNDLGNTWQNVLTLSGINLMRYQNNTLMVGTSNALHLSQNKGDAFTAITPPPGSEFPNEPSTNKNITFFGVGKDNQNNYFLGVTCSYSHTSMPPPMGWIPPDPIVRVYKSTNNGLNWSSVQSLGSVQPKDLIVTSYNEVVAIYDETKITIGKNAGADWTEKTLLEDKILTTLSSGGSQTLLIGTNDSLYVSKDRGETFNPIDVGMPYTNFLVQDPKANIKFIEAINATNYYIALPTIQGLYYTMNSGTDWNNLNDSYINENARALTSNADADVFLFTSVLNRYVNPLKLAPPVLKSLPNNSTNVAADFENIGTRTPAVFTWDEAKKAEMYQLQISADDQFSLKLVDLVYDSNTFTMNKKLEYNTKYYFKVRSRANDSYGPWTDVWTFTTEMEPPVLIYPINDTIGVSQDAQMTWEESTGATQYEVEIATDNQFSNIVYSSSTISNTFTIAENLQPITKYYWRALAKNVTNESYWSDIESFTTVSAAPTLIFPTNNQEDAPVDLTFKFKPVEAAQRYYIQVSTIEDFTDLNKIILNRSTDTDSTHFFDFLDFNKVYYYRVQSAQVVDNNGTEVVYRSRWSNVFKFTTSLPGPNLISPEDDRIDVDWENLTFIWENIQAGDQYQFQLSTDKTITTTILDTTLNSLQLNFSGKLEYYTEYFWKTRALIAGVPGAWSKVFSFYTIMESPTLLFPECAAINLPTSTTVVWKKVKGGSKYQAQLSTDISFSNIVDDKMDVVDDRTEFMSLTGGGTYNWRVRAYNDLTSSEWSETCSFQVVQGINEELAKQINLSITPNPTNNFINLNFNIEKYSQIEISIYNMEGQFVNSIYNGFLNIGAHRFNQSISNLPSGSYYLLLKIDESLLTKELKIIK